MPHHSLTSRGENGILDTLHAMYYSVQKVKRIAKNSGGKRGRRRGGGGEGEGRGRRGGGGEGEGRGRETEQPIKLQLQHRYTLELSREEGRSRRGSFLDSTSRPAFVLCAKKRKKNTGKLSLGMRLCMDNTIVKTNFKA